MKKILDLGRKFANFYLHLFPFIDIQNQKIIKKVQRLIINKNVLDVGCGDGNWSFLASKYAKGVDAFDINKIVIKNARKNKNINYFTSSIEDFIPKRRYDFIFCMQVLEHIKNDEEAMEKMIDFLGNGGHIFISTPNEEWLKNYNFYLTKIFRKIIPKKIHNLFGDLIKSKNYRKAHGHKRIGYNKEDFIRISKKLNLKIIDMFYTKGLESSYELQYMLPLPIMVLVNPMISIINIFSEKIDKKSGSFIYVLFKNNR